MGYIIKLSLSNLNRRRLRTWLTIIGVMIGTTSMVIMITAAIGAKRTLYEQLEMMDIPEGVKGTPVALIVAGLLAMAFMGFSGVDNGLARVFGI